MTKIQEKLFALQDIPYRDFSAKLIPNIEKETIIGIRTPALRKLAKEMFRSGDYAAFLEDLPHTYFEENNLHGFLLEQIKDFDTCIAAMDRFLPYVDNWATCDLMRPKVLKKNLPALLVKSKEWIQSGKPYTIRFGVEMLMCYYLDDAFDAAFPKMVAKINSADYYVNMMIAWYFATALAKQYDAVIPYIEKQKLPVWVHNKTIQKAVESYRISQDRKAYLKTLRVKSKKGNGYANQAGRE